MPVAWHYLADDPDGLANKGPQVGPVTVHQLKARFWSNEISHDTLVWRLEFHNWKALRDALPDLQQHSVGDPRFDQLNDKIDTLIKNNEWLRSKLNESGRVVVGTGQQARSITVLDWEKEQVQSLPEFLQVFVSDQSQTDRARKRWQRAFSKIRITNALRKGSAQQPSEETIQDTKRQTASRRSSLTQLCKLKAHDEDECMELMQSFGNWNVDIFKLQRLAKTPLVLVGHDLLATRLELLSQFSIPNETLLTFLQEVECGYPANPYHNALHAADAALSLYFFLEEGGLREALALSAIQVLSAILAALVHDLGHVGVNNQFLSVSRDPIALTYNDRSNLENFHVASFFKIICKAENDIFVGLEEEEYRTARRTMVEMVLATDMAQHFKHMHELRQAIDRSTGGEGTGKDATDWESAQVQELVCGVALHAADIGNVAKEWDVYCRWTALLMQEFHAQGERERTEEVSIKGAGSFASWDKEVSVPCGAV
jgi:hypothetical protein